MCTATVYIIITAPQCWFPVLYLYGVSLVTVGVRGVNKAWGKGYCNSLCEHDMVDVKIGACYIYVYIWTEPTTLASYDSKQTSLM